MEQTNKLLAEMQAKQDKSAQEFREKQTFLNVRMIPRCVAAYLRIRNRRMESCKRIFGIEGATGTSRIICGNSEGPPPVGDAVADAHLYEPELQLRTDEWLLEELYGLTAREIKTLGNYDWCPFATSSSYWTPFSPFHLDENNCDETIKILNSWSSTITGIRGRILLFPREQTPEQKTAFDFFIRILRADLTADPTSGKNKKLRDAYTTLVNLLRLPWIFLEENDLYGQWADRSRWSYCCGMNLPAYYLGHPIFL